MRHFKKIVIGLLILLLAIPTIGFGTLYFKLNSIYDKEEAGKIEVAEVKEGITNILLVGVDGDNIDRGNRSDAMIILTIDSNNNDIRLTSLARDTYVNIPGHSTEKLTHAYAYDGPSLLIQTIKENFGISIDKYAAVNFNSFINIINELGGVQIDISEAEVSQIDGINEAGTQALTGEQALAYSRIRYIDSAYQRDNRQRTVLQALYNKLTNVSNDELLDIANTLFRYTKTNMTPMEIISVGTQAIKIKDTDFDQLEFPLEGHRNDTMINNEKGWVIEWEEEYNKKALNDFIFNYITYIKEY
ncbi:LCP family protein [Romboutsia sp. 1001713B170207_170306_H8]|uniref:LCP family protein n=1 Tax=Romboutsia sp. 1001713B170207_170306_H8 TaxID=2787112 RepID=UPI000823135D|nr:LCP family protein [Romboutsia sp. 1001713B170207_170306_H8]SCH19204.1 Putative transcriptional regulator ywtF [uncultured Clostridium sp.]